MLRSEITVDGEGGGSAGKVVGILFGVLFGIALIAGGVFAVWYFAIRTKGESGRYN